MFSRDKIIEVLYHIVGSLCFVMGMHDIICIPTCTLYWSNTHLNKELFFLHQRDIFRGTYQKYLLSIEVF